MADYQCHPFWEASSGEVVNINPEPLPISTQADKSGIWIVEKDGVRLGLSHESGWVLRIRDQTRSIIEPQDLMFVLPLLEAGRPTIYSHLHAIAQEHPDIGLRVLEFPEILLLRCAFETSVSDYWPLKAIEWLDSHPSMISKLRGELDDLLQHSWATQRLKHKVKLTLAK